MVQEFVAVHFFLTTARRVRFAPQKSCCRKRTKALVGSVVPYARPKAKHLQACQKVKLPFWRIPFSGLFEGETEQQPKKLHHVMAFCRLFSKPGGKVKTVLARSSMPELRPNLRSTR